MPLLPRSYSNPTLFDLQYKDTDVEIAEIAMALNVDALIVSTVTREDENVRITVTLQHGATDTQLWTDSYTETITSVLKLQADVALAIAEAVNTEITGAERDRIETTREVDPLAHEAYMLGMTASIFGLPAALRMRSTCSVSFFWYSIVVRRPPQSFSP